MYVLNYDADNQNKLAVFTKAKDQACEMFQELKDYLNKVDTEREKSLEYEQFFNIKCFEDIHVAKESLKRNYVKFVFFGRTSNGKSIAVYAMLHDSILPSSVGNTTNSFIEVKGSKEETITVKQRYSSESKIAEQLYLYDAMSELNEEKQALIEVSWLSSKCQLLQEEICLLDCPGYNDSFNMDQELCNFCQDADVFMLVINAVFALSDQELNEFYPRKMNEELQSNLQICIWTFNDEMNAKMLRLLNLCSLLSEKHQEVNLQMPQFPSIATDFNVNNNVGLSLKNANFLLSAGTAAFSMFAQWEKIKQQHTARATVFLEKELKVVKETEVRQRIFFVSAKEVLKQRKGDTVNKKGFEDRLMEFEEFERKVMICVSETAVNTKFMKRAERGKDVISALKPVLERLFLDAGKIKRQERKEQDSADKILEDSFRNVEDRIQPTLKEVDETEFIELFFRKMNEELQSNLQICIWTFNDEMNAKMLRLSKLCRLLSENHQEQNISFEEENIHFTQVPSIATDFNVNNNVGLSLKNAKMQNFLLSAGTEAILAAIGSTWSGGKLARVTIGAGAFMGAGSVAAFGMGLVAGARFLISAISNVTLEEKRESCKRQYVEHVKSYEKEFANWASILVCGQIERELTQSLGQLKSRVESDLHQLVSEKSKRLDQEVTDVSNMRTKLDAIEEEMFSKFMEEYLKK